MQMDNKDLLDALYRHREILKLENNLLRADIAARNLATIAGKKAYLQRHNSDGTSLIGAPSQLVEQSSGHKIASLPLVSLPYLVDNQGEALDLLLHEAHKLAYRIQSLKTEFGVTIPLDKLRSLFLLSQECFNISKTIAMHGWPVSSQSCGDAETSLFDSCQSCGDAETSLFNERRICWENTWGSPSSRCGSFNDITTLSPMYTTHSPPRVIESPSYVTNALQIYSFKIVDLNVNLKWPLYVYGVVAARDDVDCNRNLLFSCSRANCQLVTQEDPFLHLTGPSRAIVAEEPVDFEVELKIKCGTDQSQDKALISATNHYSSRGDVAFFWGRSCSAELSLETLPRAVQAVILSIRVVGGVSLFEFGGRIACSSSTEEYVDPTRQQVVLVESAEKIPEDGGYLALSRKVVSVGLQGGLKVAIQAYGGSGRPSVSGLLFFPSKYCRVSQLSCLVGDTEVEVTVAWSWLVRSK
ncbi:uncharacterized protein LOC123428526 [Hordeum vulgare subsp. vulgare]|uniref:DUF6598 domain-containing protein n=1 Tax=Hordeum vulgare subsp. vulgare TaxID=112509 RepID=A0A8I6WLV2_HORVV|nr:uncharacterized protein LOC123428526 [Hordeum vulgare subsp. vulgare]